MQGDNVPYVPWSRHFLEAASAKKNLNKGTTNDYQYDNYKRRQASLDCRRKAISESNLVNGCKLNVSFEDDSWDSQSDPGTASPEKPTRFGINKRYYNPAEISGSTLEYIYQTKKPTGQRPRIPLHGRAGGKQVQLRRKKEGHNKVGAENHVVVEIPMEDWELSAGGRATNYCPRYVHSYFDFIYYCCLTPNKWAMSENNQQTKRQFALSTIQKVIYCYITIMATFSSINEVKYQLINFLDDRTLHQLIDVGYFLVGCAIHWYITYYFVFRQDIISKQLQKWNDYEKAFQGENEPENTNKMEWLPIITGIGTIAFSIIKSISYTDLESWSLEGLILENSEDTAYCIFLWKPDQLRSESFHEDYGTNLNWVTYAMGIVGLMSTICWNLSVDIFKDLLIWIAFVNKHHMLRFGDQINKSVTRKRAIGKNSEQNDDHCWQMYREVIQVNSDTNSTFCFIFLINHLHSFMVSSYWLTQVLNTKTTLRVLVLVGYNVVKGIFSYLPAQQASGQTDKCRKWIQTLPSQTERFRVDDTPYTRELMLMELEKEPLGLGRGKVHINNEFLISFITLVISLFCFLLNIRPKDEEESLIY